MANMANTIGTYSVTGTNYPYSKAEPNCEECKRHMLGETGEDCEDYQDWDGHCVNYTPFEPQAQMSPKHWASEVFT